MTFKMYVLYNKLTQLYEGIMLYRSNVIAQRGFEAMIEKAKPQVDPDDFVLYSIGEFDNETGKVSPFPSMQLVEFVPRTVAEESKMSSERTEDSVL